MTFEATKDAMLDDIILNKHEIRKQIVDQQTKIAI